MTKPSLSLPASLQDVVQAYAELPDTRSRLAQLIAWGKALPAMPDESKTDERKVPGCLASVYLSATLEDDCVVYQGDSDTLMVKGLVALLIRGLNGLTPEQILAISPDFIVETGLKQSLIPSRANGFFNIFVMMQTLARQWAEG